MHSILTKGWMDTSLQVSTSGQLRQEDFRESKASQGYKVSETSLKILNKKTRKETSLPPVPLTSQESPSENSVTGNR